MKHSILLVAFLLLPLLSFSQGVKFEQGSWNDALALAKKNGKPVLLNLCFSDKELISRSDNNMNNLLFSLEAVGDVCNIYFVCYKMDATTKEGLALAKKYGIYMRPTLLFVNADGRLLSTMQSIAIPVSFMEWTNKLLLDLKSSKPMAVWEAEFPKKKQDLAFLLEYIAKRNELGLPINEALDAYLKLIPANGPMSEQAAKLFQSNASQAMVTDYAYQYFSANKSAFFETLPNIDGDTPYENYQIFQSAVQHTIGVATLSKDEALLKKAVDAFQQIPYEMSMKLVEECYMDYYKQTNEPDKYVAHGRLLVADILKRLDSVDLLMKNSASSQNLQKRLASEKDTFRTKSSARLIKELPDLERVPLCNKLNNFARYIFETSSNKAELKKALTWSEKAVQYNPKSSGFLDTNAKILYKLGRKEEAIAMEKRAIAYFGGPPGYKEYTDALNKMEEGEKLW